MSAFTKPYADVVASSSSQQSRPTASHTRKVSSGGMLAERDGAVPLPVGTTQRQFGAMAGDASAPAGIGPAGMPRSPPKNKNTQHVPCKFFIYGQCQAGRTCPFSHDLESTTRPAPCKFFAKGSCKFGRKCALLHVTPDGTVVNRPQGFAPGPSFTNTQATPGQFPAHQTPQGLLSQGLERRHRSDTQSDVDNYQYSPRNGYDGSSQMDALYTPGSPQYGSPLQDNRYPISPPLKGLSVLDAPLPNSFDSNGVSLAARNGPFAASVPSRFSIDSPPSSLPMKFPIGNSALRDLHNSAFGDRGMDGVLAGSSPPSGPDEPLKFPKRPLHMDSFAQRQMLSASLGTKLPTQSFEYSDDEDDGDTDRENDLLPAALHDLIPEGRARGDPRSRIDEGNTPAGFLAAQRRTLSSQGTTQESKVGSPHSSSPSRYSGVFNRRTESDYSGHVGSPLRNSGFVFASPSLHRTKGDLSPTISSPPRQASMSMLTQELQRTKLDAALSQAASSTTTPAIHRSISNGSTSGRASFERSISGNATGRVRTDEEQALFDMDEVGDHSRMGTTRAIAIGPPSSNHSWGQRSLASSPGNGEPTFGAIGGHRAGK